MNNVNVRKWWALAALSLALLAVGLDATVLNLALPTLAGALKASEADLQWIVAAYSLALAAAMLPGGLLGDRFGRKKVLILALAVFGLGSLACAYAPNAPVLIGARTVLGLAAAVLVTMSLSVLTVLFTPEERPRAVGIWAAANFLALPIGPILGGWLLTNFWWGWVFLLNVPVTVIAILAVALLLPETRSAQRPGFDIAGILTSSAGLVALMYGFIKAGQNGWGNIEALASLLAGILLLAGFVEWESYLNRRASLPGASQPLVDLSLFRSASFTWGTILAAMGIFTMFGGLFALPQYFQAILGLNPQGSGLHLLPLIAGVVIGAVLSDRLAALAGAKVTVSLGLALLAGGMAAGSTTNLTSGEVFTAIWITVCGMGMGVALSTAASAALNQLTPERSGVGSGLMQAVQKLGGPLGVAILGSILDAVYESQLDLSKLPPQAADAVKQSVFAGIKVAQQLKSAALFENVRSAFLAGMDNLLLVCGGIALISIILTLAFLPGRGKVTPPAKVKPASSSGFGG